MKHFKSITLKQNITKINFVAIDKAQVIGILGYELFLPIVKVRSFVSFIDLRVLKTTKPTRTYCFYFMFQLAFNIAVLIACCLGFYVYSLAKLKRHNSQVTLDIVLLFICVVGPLLVGIFSALGLIVGPEDTKANGWIVSLFSALADVIVSIVQVCRTNNHLL